MNTMYSNSQNSKPYDVLIVGAGVSGLFAAWRLLNESQSNNLNVLIVEKLGRTGGRLETTKVEITGKDGKKVTVRDEEGGMRFVPKGNGMEYLWTLIDDLKLKTIPFVMGDDNNCYYIRGKTFTQKTVDDSTNEIWSTLFNLATYEEGKDPTDILSGVMNDILRQNEIGKTPNSPEDWINFRNSCTYEDFEGNKIPIHKWGFWSLLHRYGLTQECIEMLDHVFGFMGPFDAFINAGEGLQILFDFPNPKATPFRTMKNGFGSLPGALAKAIQAKNGRINLNETVSSVYREENLLKVVTDKDTYAAEKVILAIPKKPMKKLIRNSALLGSNHPFVKAVNSVKNMELTKVGLYFNERWWHTNKTINLTNGPNFTDLPMGSLYCFSQYPDDPKKDANYSGPAALTQYTDYERGNFWKEMQNIGPMYQTDDFPENPENTYPASVNLVNEIMKQIKLLLGLRPDDDSVPMPVISTYRVWGQGDYGYGYHQYKININDQDDVYPNIWNPVENVYVCNESWSPEQGWVEGALIMSDFMLTQGFGLKPFVSENEDYDRIKSSKNC